MQEQYLTAIEVGKSLGISYRTVENWGKQGYLQRNEKGRYGLVSTFQYRLKQLKEEVENYKTVGDMAGLKLRKLQAETDKEIAIARIRTLEADKLEGILVDAEEVGETWKGYVLRCRAKLLSLPNKLALELSEINQESEIEQILQKTIDEALSELS